METDSTLASLALIVSVVFFAVAETGIAAIAGRLRELAELDSDQPRNQLSSLRLVTNLPGGPTSPLRLTSLTALSAAMLSVGALIVSIWGVRWDLVAAGAVVLLVLLAAITFASRSVGIRYSGSLCGVMARTSWILSFPLRPLLLIEGLILSNNEPEGGGQTQDPALDLTLAVDTFDEPLDEYEVRMIRGVVELDRTVAREIMVPRVDIVAVESGTTLAAVVEQMNSAGHSRVPIYDGDLDNIVGVAHARDLLPRLAVGGDATGVDADEVSRKPLFIPESKTLEGLLDVFQESRTHMAIVVDEYGGVSGIVTIEDLLEEIVGEIRDEFDSEEPGIQQIAEREYLVDGGMPVDELNEALGINVVGDGFDTIGGFVFDRLGKVPVVGDMVQHDGLVIEVVRVTGRRPRTLRVGSADASDSGTSSTAATA